ncbi:TetR/AcrR family transcriptional regulator [Kordiimonas sp. SCSIO 12610]|uniref:TetR/AcrR family transcriptional regulator n=1 Tax=Kordiimonas sp. SCSIO 12610 TaxID=2829597 RepID=UPI002109AA83|nr:TetR/AcrR family transcriptional regulator [Kordiimonas sp. SCSIO 12610]UTW56499.1 helix-turn-helix transcriptional regulator [Kordiimonas sp. SCSIO 12610]
MNAKDILAAFAQYGFRKTSMQDIANAAGVSRQSIYKKFGNKENCYNWTINTYLSGMYGRIFELLNNEEMPPMFTLTKVFDILIGEAIDIVNNGHGTEILDDTLEITYSSHEDWPIRLRARMADFLYRNGYASTAEEGGGKAFVMISAGKGLLLEAKSRDIFQQDMRQILEAMLGRTV